MDVFVFPSKTDTFGNVVLEAMASGVPSIVSMGGGPKYIIRPGVDGDAEPYVETCAQSILALYHNPALRQQISANARQRALTFSWDAVFSSVYAKYEEAFPSGLLRNF
jgi:phosphatidylinositol alpha 1,6-mannosyltransferase